MTTLIPFIIAIIAPFVFAIMNVMDKFVATHRMKKPLSYAFFAGMANLVFGIVLACFLDWSSVTFADFLVPAFGGLLFGLQYYLFFGMVKEEDISSVIGLIYLYPVVVGVLSFFILKEILSPVSYFGLLLVLVGVLLLSLRKFKISGFKHLWIIVVMILITAIYEFLIKVSTIRIPELNGLSINFLALGVSLLPLLLHRATRNGLVREAVNIKWAFIIEGTLFFGTGLTFFAMSGLSATIVSSVAAIQPLAVLMVERTVNKFGVHICRDQKLLPNLVSLVLIVVGILLLYLPELLSEL